jgi:hypothetical protein
MSAPPVVEALRVLLGFLASQRIDYMVLGGLAVRILALPRSTMDVDVMVAVGEADVASFAQAADRAGFQVDEAFQRGYLDRLAGLGKIHFHLVREGRAVRIDVFVLLSEYQRAAFERRKPHASEVGPLSVISPEDLLLHKLLADRPRDRSDVADLLLVCGPLDQPYLRHWAERLGVQARVDQALREAGRTK